MRLCFEVPPLVLLGLLCRGVALAAVVLGPTPRERRRGTYHCAPLENQVSGDHPGVEGGKSLSDQVVGLEQMPLTWGCTKAQYGALLGKMVFTNVKTRTLTGNGCVVQFRFHGGVGQVEPPLKEVDADRAPAANGARPPLAPRTGMRGATRAKSSVNRTKKFILLKSSRSRVLFVLR